MYKTCYLSLYFGNFFYNIYIERERERESLTIFASHIPNPKKAATH